MEDFYQMDRRTKLLYIASELLEDKDPMRRDITLIPKK